MLYFKLDDFFMAYGSANGSLIRILLILGLFSLGLSFMFENGNVNDPVVQVFFFEILGLFLILYSIIIWRTQQK